MAHSESKLQRELALTRRLDRLVMAPKFELLAFCAPEFVLLKRLKNKSGAGLHHHPESRRRYF